MFSQDLPPVCGPNPMMTSTCGEACIICDIDGFTGRNDSSIKGEAPSDFCTSFVHHMQWIGFVAGSTTLKIQITVTNCAQNNGLEVGLYKGIDCKNYQRISICDTDIKPGEVVVFSNTVPLEIGQYYYIVMDGSDGDICDWTFKVLEGTTKLGVLNDVAPIEAPSRVCVGKPIDIKTPGLTGATDFLWRVDGNIIGTGKSITHTINIPGKYNICLTPRNVCQTGPENCREIEILPNTVDTIIAEVCDKDCYAWFGEKLCTSGNYIKTVPNTNGCDSNIVLDLTVLETFDESKTITICTDDTIRIGEYVLTKAGIYDLTLYNADSCEIILTLELITLDCAIRAVASTDSLLCRDDNTGKLFFKVINGIPPFEYKIEKIENSSFLATGDINLINQEIEISGLSAGNYFGSIEDNQGRTTYIFTTIYEPPKIELQYSTSQYNGYEVSCFGGSDGQIMLSSTGGTKPYTYYDFSNNLMTPKIDNLAEGLYQYIVIDKNGCIDSISMSLDEPDSLSTSYTVKKLDCTGYNSGRIDNKSIVGGVEPYGYTLDGKVSTFPITNLTSGTYSLDLIDANGCFSTDVLTIDPIEIPSLSIDTLAFKINLGDNAIIDVNDTIDAAKYMWIPTDRVVCPECLDTEIMAVNNSSYTIVATSTDGCKDSLTIRIDVDKIRSFIVSNIMSLASTIGNEHTKYYGGKDVEIIQLFALYDRWGNKVYEAKDLPSGVGSLEELPRLNGKKLSLGVYSWVAKVKYIDDVILYHKGDITIME